MKIPNKQELQQITFNQSSDIDYGDLLLINIYKKCTANPNTFLVIEFYSDNSLYFRKNLLERI